MSQKSCIKGSVYATVAEDVNKILSGGELSREQAARWLEVEDFRLLGQTVNVALWYDVRSYHRLNCLLRDVAGGGSNEYLRERGRHTARRLGESGLYSQLEYLRHTRVAETLGTQERCAAFTRDLTRLNTLSASILNFSRWNSRPDPDHPMRLMIEVSEARDVPETLAWRSDGFVNEMACQHDRNAADLWTWRREHLDVLVFRMTREI